MQVIQGAPKTILARFTSKSSKDPVDFTTYDEIRFCFSSAGKIVYKKSLLTVGDTDSSLPTLTNIPDTSDLEIADPIAGPGVPANAKILTVDDANTVTMTVDGVNPVNATATASSVALAFGDVAISGNPLLGKVSVTVDETNTGVDLPEGSATIEAKIVIGGVTRYVQFTETLDVISKFC